MHSFVKIFLGLFVLQGVISSPSTLTPRDNGAEGQVCTHDCPPGVTYCECWKLKWQKPDVKVSSTSSVTRYTFWAETERTFLLLLVRDISVKIDRRQAWSPPFPQVLSPFILPNPYPKIKSRPSLLVPLRATPDVNDGLLVDFQTVYTFPFCLVSSFFFMILWMKSDTLLLSEQQILLHTTRTRLCIS
jgi:hypothetical protein